MKSITVPQKKRGRPATGETPRLGVRLADDITNAIDAFAANEPDQPGRSEAVRRILKDWLIGHGYIANPADKDGNE